MGDVKKCTMCLKVKKLDLFAVNKRNKTDGRQPRCKECNKQYYLANKKKIQKRIKKNYYDNHEEKLKRRRELARRPGARKKKAQQDKAYYLKNKETISEKYKKWARANRERLNAYARQYYNNLDCARYLTRSANARRNARIKNNGNNTLTIQQVEELFKKHPFCEYCGKFECKLVVDHIIPISKGGQNCIENVTIACESCNLSKGDKLLSEWNLLRDSDESRLGQDS